MTIPEVKNNSIIESIFGHCTEKTWASCSKELLVPTIIALATATAALYISNRLTISLVEGCQSQKSFTIFPPAIQTAMILTGAAVVTALALPLLLALQINSAAIAILTGVFWTGISAGALACELRYKPVMDSRCRV